MTCVRPESRGREQGVGEHRAREIVRRCPAEKGYSDSNVRACVLVTTSGQVGQARNVDWRLEPRHGRAKAGDPGLVGTFVDERGGDGQSSMASLAVRLTRIPVAIGSDPSTGSSRHEPISVLAPFSEINARWHCPPGGGKGGWRGDNDLRTSRREHESQSKQRSGQPTIRDTVDLGVQSTK